MEKLARRFRINSMTVAFAFISDSLKTRILLNVMKSPHVHPSNKRKLKATLTPELSGRINVLGAAHKPQLRPHKAGSKGPSMLTFKSPKVSKSP